jgi:hypothetical protein
VADQRARQGAVTENRPDGAGAQRGIANYGKPFRSSPLRELERVQRLNFTFTLSAVAALLPLLSSAGTNT